VLVAVDAHYGPDRSTAGCVVFTDWTDSSSSTEHTATVPCFEPYQPGALFRRELPAIQAVVERLTATPSVIVVDGYVWLDAQRTRQGLGAHLFDALSGDVAIIGVAKNPFPGSQAREVRRGRSSRPLFVTAAGIDEARAAEAIASMHGQHRLPTLLLRADHLARSIDP
jgi:deoxyribonuclease V